jgi:hypothetical protein
MRYMTAPRKPSGNRRALHHSTNVRLQRRTEVFPCGQIDNRGRADVLSKLHTMRGTLTAEIHGDMLTCIFAPQRRSSLNKLIKRVTKLLRTARQTNTSRTTHVFA